MQKRMKPLLLAGLLSLVAAALSLTAACGGSAPEEVEIAVTIRDDRMSPATIQVKQDDTVTLKIDSDIPGAFHLHGYDIEREVQPGEVSDLAFTADATGRYRIAFHKASSGGSSSGHSHGESAGTTASMEHGSGGGHGPAESEAPISIDIAVEIDSFSGVNVEIVTDGFRFAPEEVNQANTPGAGHAHIYVDGQKVNRVYGGYYHLEGLEPGPREIRVALNDNGHSELTMNGQALEAVTTLEVEALIRKENPREKPVEAESAMSVKAVAHPDELGGYNLQVIPAGLRFAGAKAGESHVPGEGHAYVSIDGEHHSRLYTDWLKLPPLEPGMHEITVALANNAYQPYHWQGRPVAATITVHEEKPAQSPASGHDSGGMGSMDGAADPGQETEIDVGYLEVQPR